MNMGPEEAKSFGDAFLPLVKDSPHRWALFPTYVTLHQAISSFQGSSIQVGAQNSYFEPKGAFTGEISSQLLKEVGCTLALVGHSERRQYFGETDESCAKKVAALQALSLEPMLCIGETKQERENNQTKQVLEKQLKAGLQTADLSKPLSIAYEPVWAIGTGLVATPEMVAEAHKTIRIVLNDLKGSFCPLPILYGGSVKPENCKDLSSIDDVDGFLVGGASLDPKSFAKIGEMSV